MKLYVHDFLVDYFTGPQTGDVCCGIDVYYTFEKNYDLPYVPNSSLAVYVGTPKGISNYLERVANPQLFGQIFFFRPLIVVKEYDEREVFSFIRTYLEQLDGRDEKELILRAMNYFDVHEDTYRVPDIYSYLLHGQR